jgi:hypothetical protein
MPLNKAKKKAKNKGVVESLPVPSNDTLVITSTSAPNTLYPSTADSQVITMDNTAPPIRKKAKTTHTSTILTPIKAATSSSLSLVHNDDAITSLLKDNQSVLQPKQKPSSSSPKKGPSPPKNSEVPMKPVGPEPNTPTANTTVLTTTTIAAPSPTDSSVLVVSPVPACLRKKKTNNTRHQKRAPTSPFSISSQSLSKHVFWMIQHKHLPIC